MMNRKVRKKEIYIRMTNKLANKNGKKKNFLIFNIVAWTDNVVEVV